MSSTNEVERLQRVYQGYEQAQATQTLWNNENLGNQAIVNERMSLLHRLLDVHGFCPLAHRRVLEIGCGTGTVLATLRQWGASSDNLYGVDLLPERIALAKQNFQDINFQTGNAEQLEFGNQFFDLVLFFTVFSSILDSQMAQHVASEASRVLKPGGAILWYDFRYKNPRNPHTHPMRIQDIKQLFPTFRCHLQTITLFPPLARRLGSLTQALYPRLSWIPVLRTHYTGLLISP